MSMSTHVYGFRPPDERWAQMKAAWDACRTAGVDPPDEVDEFFNGEPPDDAGVEVALGDAVTGYRVEMDEGYEVRVDKLPPDVTIVRFVNSY